MSPRNKNGSVTHKEMSDEMLIWTEKIRVITVDGNKERDERIKKLEDNYIHVIKQLVSFDSIKRDIEDIKETIKKLVTTKELTPIKMLVYGAVAAILMGTVTLAGGSIVWYITQATL